MKVPVHKIVGDACMTYKDGERVQCEFREAFDAAQKSLAVAERLNDPSAIARAFEMLALACHSLGEWQQGLNFENQRSLLTGPGLDVTEAFDVHL